MNNEILTDPIPLTTDKDGVKRVGDTRVTLDTVVDAFSDGATAEEIAQQYPVLSLADIYAVISHYLRHRADVEQYLDRRSRQISEVRSVNESRHNPIGIRERLLVRRDISRSGS